MQLALATQPLRGTGKLKANTKNWYNSRYVYSRPPSYNRVDNYVDNSRTMLDTISVLDDRNHLVVFLFLYLRLPY